MPIEQKLRIAAYFVEQIPQEMFNMSHYRDLISADEINKQCGTVGCAMGHLTAIIEDDDIEHNILDDRINFKTTADIFCEDNEGLFEFLFSGCWIAHDNTVTGAAARLRYCADNLETYKATIKRIFNDYEDREDYLFDEFKELYQQPK